MSIIAHTFDLIIPSRAAKLVGLGLAAGLAYGLAAPPPAFAADSPTDWRGACVDKGSPQGSGQMPRADKCMRQQACQDLANTAGRTIFESGCFWVDPDGRPNESVLRR